MRAGLSCSTNSLRQQTTTPAPLVEDAAPPLIDLREIDADKHRDIRKLREQGMSRMDAEAVVAAGIITDIIDAPAAAPPRPPIYALYEQTIGLMNPFIAEELKAAAEKYPMDWIEQAFKESAMANARNWRYIKAILERWEREGKDSGKSASPTQSGPVKKKRY